MLALLRPLAEADLLERALYYQTSGGPGLGEPFFDAAIAALEAMGRGPRVGSSRLGDLCDIPGLRVRRIDGFPCGWYYFVGDDQLDVIRLLADAQDLSRVRPVSAAARSARGK